MNGITLMSLGKNEGMFLVEWLAHHFALGIDRVVMATNDCDDGSPDLLHAIGRHFPVHHVENSAPMGQLSIHERANRRMMALPQVAKADWVLHVDPDEFLNVRVGDGSVRALADLHADADAVAILWRIFGDNGRRYWDGGFVTEAFWMCEETIPEGRAHKSLFRPSVFGWSSPHMPKEPNKPVDELRIVNTRGEALPLEHNMKPRRTGYALPMELMTWDNACVHHYQVKSRDLSLLKLDRGAANRRGVEKRQPWHKAHRAFNLNQIADRAIDRMRSARLDWVHRLLAVPEIEARHIDCLRWYLARRPLLRQLDAEDPAYRP